MNKSILFLFYFVALCAASYFLWEYIHAPRALIISLIISLAIVGRAVWQKSKYASALGITLISAHLIWLIGFLIPVYDKQPDIRQRYRRSKNLIVALPDATGTLVTLQHGAQSSTSRASTFVEGKPIYQGDTVITAGASINSNGNVLIGFWDSSNIQMFPQSSLTIEKLAPDFSGLDQSRIGIILSGGVIGAYTRRSKADITNRYVRAGANTFFCRECLIAFSGSAGMMASKLGFSGQLASGDVMNFTGGTYTFSSKGITLVPSSALMGTLTTVHNATINHNALYDTTKDEFIKERWGRPLDKSALLSNASKLKMAIVGLFDWTAWEQYNYLLLFESLQNDEATLPGARAEQKNIYEFLQ